MEKLLKEAGFFPEYINDTLGWSIKYEGYSLIVPGIDEDSDTLNMILPKIYDIDDADREAVYAAMVRLTTRMKFVQPMVMGEKDDEVWLNYQHFLNGHPADADLIAHMADILAHGAYTLGTFIDEATETP